MVPYRERGCTHHIQGVDYLTGSVLLSSLLTKHFITIILIAAFGLKLMARKKTRNAELRYSWITIICCSLLVIEDLAESMTALDPGLVFWRILLSVIGYTLRPAAAVGLLLVICPPGRRTWRVWILCLVNFAVYATAFFSPIAFSFDEEYQFVRGPLGYFGFFVALLYLIQVLMLTWKRFYEGRNTERWLLIICGISCIAAAFIDASYGGCRVNEAIMISSVFFYMFLRAHDNRLDSLTALDNRFAFYDDTRYKKKSISAIASIDINGLKTINDTQGHAAGDTAIEEISRCLRRVNSHDTTAYRLGGDEFVIVFVQQALDAIEQKMAKVKAAVIRSGYSISTGCAVMTESESVEDVLRKSDRCMYEDKAAYYRQKGIDRRAHIGMN